MTTFDSGHSDNLQIKWHLVTNFDQNYHSWSVASDPHLCFNPWQLHDEFMTTVFSVLTLLFILHYRKPRGRSHSRRSDNCRLLPVLLVSQFWSHIWSVHFSQLDYRHWRLLFPSTSPSSRCHYSLMTIPNSVHSHVWWHAPSLNSLTHCRFMMNTTSMIPPIWWLPPWLHILQFLQIKEIDWTNWYLTNF